MKAVYVHRPDGHVRLSFTKPGWGQILASPRKDNEVSFEDWSRFEAFVGLPETTNVCKYFPVLRSAWHKRRLAK